MKRCPICTAEAPDDAGKCTNCGKPFDQPAGAPISPGDAPAAALEEGKGEQGEAGTGKPPSSPAPPTAQEITRTACPQCKEPWKAGSVLCLSCGYDARVGRKLSTVHGMEEPPTVVRPTTGLAPVRTGLVLHLIVVSLWLFSIPLSVILAIQRVEVAALTAGAEEGGQQYRTPLIAAIVMLLTLIVLAALQWVLGLIGSALCLWIPRQSRARGWLVASLVLGVAIVPGGIAVVWLNGAPMLLSLIWLPSLFAWILSLRNTAYYLGRRDEAQETVGILVHLLIVLLLIPLVGFPVLLLSVLWLISQQNFECLGAVVGLVAGVLASVGWLYYYVKVLFGLFRVIAALRQGLLPKPSETAATPGG